MTLNVNESVTTSENLNEIFAALAKAQGKIQPACKDKSNPFFKSKYADLASIWDACREYLSENGLCVTQFPQTKSDGLYLTSILGHSSGQWIKSEILIPIAKNDPQSIGSAITYFRRYTLSSITGVAPEDDDGEKAQAGFRQKTVNIENIPKKITKQQADELGMILNDCEATYKAIVYAYIKKEYGTDSLVDLPAEIYPRVKEAALKNMEIAYEKQKINQDFLVAEGQ